MNKHTILKELEALTRCEVAASLCHCADGTHAVLDVEPTYDGTFIRAADVAALIAKIRDSDDHDAY